MPVARSETWRLYPLGLPRGEVDANDLHRYYNDLQSRAADLFAADETICHVELREHTPGRPPLLVHCEAAAGPSALAAGPGEEHRGAVESGSEEGRLSAPVSVSTAESLRFVLDAEPSRGSTRVFTIFRANSWSRMQITQDMFRTLCAALGVTPRLVGLLRGMQYKSAPGDEHFMSCYWDIHGIATGPPSDTSNKSAPATGAHAWFEVCYNLRHFEQHGRDLVDPWSCRQTVLHHRHVFAQGCSSWVIVHPSTRWQGALDDVRIDGIVHPLSLHLRSLSSATANNWEYLEYLSSQLLSLDKRAALPKALAQFDFDFTLSQHVHAIRKRLHRFRTIVDGTLRVVAALSSLGEALEKPGGIPTSAHNAFSRELGHIERELEAYNIMTRELLSFSADIKSMINSIIEFRNQGIFNSNGFQLKRLAEDSSHETRAMAITAKHTYTDSRTVRIATIIALIYLPASLVLTFFSTVFVDMRPVRSTNTGDGNEGGGTQLVIYNHIWIAILSMVVMCLGTGGWFWLWDRRRHEAAIRLSLTKCRVPTLS